MRIRMMEKHVTKTKTMTNKETNWSPTLRTQTKLLATIGVRLQWYGNFKKMGNKNEKKKIM